MTEELTLSRALQTQYFVDYLTKYINGNINWKEISDKCINKNNEYCLSMIKSKAWIDKEGEYKSYKELFDELLKKQISFNAFTLSLLHKGHTMFPVYILKLNENNKKLSNFYIETSQQIFNITKNIFDLCEIKYKIIDIKDINEKEENVELLWYDVISYENIPKLNLHMYIFLEYFISYVIYREDITQQNSIDINNAKYMLWEYLIYNTITYPNVYNGYYVPPKNN